MLFGIMLYQVMREDLLEVGRWGERKRLKRHKFAASFLITTISFEYFLLLSLYKVSIGTWQIKDKNYPFFLIILRQNKIHKDHRSSAL